MKKIENRYSKFVFEDEMGIKFEEVATDDVRFVVSVGTSGELIVKKIDISATEIYLKLPSVSAGEYAEECSVYTDSNGNKAIIPFGWTVSAIKEENTIWGTDVSLVIYCIPKEIVPNINWSNLEEIEFLQKNYDQFVWVPVKLLDADGTVNGENFNERFGRRNYRENQVKETEYNDELVDELNFKLENITRNGGYYISRYDISKNLRSGKLESVKNKMCLDTMKLVNDKKVIIANENSKIVISYMNLVAEYDTVEAWLIKTHAKTIKEISQSYHIYADYTSPLYESFRTGQRKECCANNIYDFSGHTFGWEKNWIYKKDILHNYFIRGDNYYSTKNSLPEDIKAADFYVFGFRATLYVE